MVGYKSGKRSAVIDIGNGMFIRLKGCGNLEKGAIIENMVYPPELMEIRGV